MRTSLISGVLAILALCATTILGADPPAVYETRWHISWVNPNTKAFPQPIKYLIKVKGTPQKDVPVFYGAAGRVPVEAIRDQYSFFDQQIDAFDNAIVVYVEQRMFGASKYDASIPNKLADLAELKLANVLEDHISLIKALSTQYNTKNFLAFGAGHGGVIVGYLAQEFAKRAELKDFKVLAWASSPPHKYLYPALDGVGTYKYQALGTTVANLLANEGGCTLADAQKLADFFTQLKAVDASATLTGAYLSPAITDAELTKDLQELALFIRNSIFDLTYDDALYKSDSEAKRVTEADRPLKRICGFLRTYTTGTAMTKDILNSLLVAIFPDASTNNPKWKVTNDGSNPPQWNHVLAAKAYQDCTELRIGYCPLRSDANDPFKGSEFLTDRDCNTQDNYKAEILEQCRVLFRDDAFDFNDASHLLKKADYSVEWKTNTLVSMNQRSQFYGSYTDITRDKAEQTYAFSFELSGNDQWGDFDPVRICDTDKSKDVRYLALRGFACFTGLAASSSCPGNSLFYDDDSKNPYDDTEPDANKFPSCPVETDPKKVAFDQWGHAAFYFKGQEPPTTTTTTTTTTAPPPTTQGASTGMGVSMASVLVSSLFVWFTANRVLV